MTITMSPARVLACQADLSRRLHDDARFNGFLFLVLKTQFQDAIGIWSDSLITDQARMCVGSLHWAVRSAEAYHVSATMTQVVQAAAAGLDDTDQFDSSLAPSLSGIVRFDGGLEVVDIRGRVLRINWLVWNTGAFKVDLIGGEAPETGPLPGINWYEFNDAIDDPDEISREVGVKNGERVYGRWGFAGMNVATDGQRLGPSLVEAQGLHRARAEAAGATIIPASNTMRLLHAFFLLLQQEITVTSKARPHPSTRPELKKARLSRNPDVTVVELRKHRYVKAAAAGERQVEWDHRWYVRGFWRWQVCGAGRALRRRIWVDGFVKGPEGKPLVIKNRVSDLRR